jgi:hypothetical protein
MQNARKLRSLLAGAAVALVAVGCVPNDSPIRLLGARPLLPSDTGECKAAEIQLLSGSLDVSATNAYVIQFDVQSDLQQISTTVGGETVAGPGRNDFFANEIVYSYASTPSFAFEQEAKPVHFVVPAGAGSDKSFVILNLIAPKAAQQLTTWVPTGAGIPPDQPYNLNVTIQARGNLQSGQAITTNQVTYPIRVFNTGFAGCPGGAQARTGPCGSVGGQDGSAVYCL